MKNLVYCLFNTLSCRYGDVFNFPTDGFAVRRLNEQGANGVLKLPELVLYRIGEIDVATGVLVPCPPVPIPWSSSPSLESEMS